MEKLDLTDIRDNQMAGLMEHKLASDEWAAVIAQKHPGCRLQRSDHGCGHKSIQVFDAAGQIVADYDVCR